MDFKTAGKILKKNAQNSPNYQTRIEENKEREARNAPLAQKGERLCPFMSVIEKTYCGPHCKLYREQKDGHNCPFQEIYSISWKLSEILKKWFS